jgi:hypothetical protein
MDEFEAPRRRWPYHFYGIGVSSALRFPELSPRRSPVDVEVRVGRVEAPAEVRQRELNVIVGKDGTFYCGGASIGVLAVRSGTEIVIDLPDEQVDERLMRHVVLGVAMRALLHQRGVLVLHASVVAIAGRGVAFIGDNGAGKSTIAAAFLGCGQRVASDDIAAIDVSRPVPIVYPGVPQLKLSPQVAARFCSSPRDLGPLISNNFKLAWRNPDGWLDEPLSLERVYALSSGPENLLHPFGRHDALVALLRNSYAAQLGLLQEGNAFAKHIGQCMGLVQRASVRSLVVRRDLAKIGDVMRMVMNDCDCN